MAKPKSRPDRWSDAISRATEALDELLELQAEYQVQVVGIAKSDGTLELTVFEGHTGTKEVLVVRSRR